ncbi:uncharacterized protein EKO05_0008243 [Ascochyta rabiei]|uniref:Uncharacterized protein n=1 Tax=Didymella rabiei TaxID=5454 RepID=A0A163D958_DIDRA|nr:uncharacterized protein EKO05_0008243 [Ascochyta rabiei]KZM23002.1 hypothetical protein ST47_g5791 [Ascochyta rabiei]UPX17917.1 hypothetical protein EKO05_0008243 [Ascochyta rabiei]
MALKFHLQPTAPPKPEHPQHRRPKSPYPQEPQKPKLHPSNIIKDVKRHLHMPRSVRKFWAPHTQSDPQTSRGGETGKRSGAVDGRVLDDMGLCRLTRVSARRDEVETREAGGQDEWRLEGEFRWGRSWVNWEGVRVFEKDVWWK